MSNLLDWLAAHESALSAVAAIIAIGAGLGVAARLMWTRMPSQVMSKIKRPAFLSDWHNIALICVTSFALALLFILTLDKSGSNTNSALSDISGKPSVAVLPLTNISGDPEQEYLADGIAEDVITLLSRNPRFFVIARNSSFTYRDQAVDIRRVGEELGVRYVVEGSVRKIGERLRVTVQLIEAASGQHVWAENYDRPFAEIFSLQDEITDGIAVALGDQIFRAEIARASSISTDNLDAWGLVMRASQSLINWNNESSAQAVELFRSALELDPDYALASAELGRTLCWRVVNVLVDNPDEVLVEAYKLVEQALQKAPNDPLVLFDVGACYVSTGRPAAAVRLLKKAVAKQPNYDMALALLGVAYAFNEQSEQALSHFNRALKLAPQSPHIYLYESWRSIPLLELGLYTEAEQALHNALESYDGWWWTWLDMAAARAGQCDIEEARQNLYNAREKEPLFSLSFYKSAAAIVYKNKGKNVLALLEPIWPEDLLIANENRLE